MQVGDLVYWSANPSILGIVLEDTGHIDIYHQACRVLWANGVESNHSTTCFKKVETSENK